MARKIMVVDDDEAMRNLATIALKMRGFTVVTAATGLQAVQRAPQERPELIVMDINMPDLDGISALEQLKSNPATRDIPVLMISSLPADVVTPEAFQGGAFAFLEKPFELAALASEVRTTLARRTQ